MDSHHGAIARVMQTVGRSQAKIKRLVLSALIQIFHQGLLMFHDGSFFKGLSNTATVS